MERTEGERDLFFGERHPVCSSVFPVSSSAGFAYSQRHTQAFLQTQLALTA
jgi:hypothetical protein